MGKFNFIKTKIEGLYEIEPTLFGDDRGYFMETYNDEFKFLLKHIDGSVAEFVQDNESKSRKGVLRGLHMQFSHPQAKLVRVINGEVWDVAVDVRKDSPTFGKWHGVLLSADNKKQFFVPEGFLHGFVVLSDAATFVYKCTRLYEPDDEYGVAWDDADIDVKWPTTEVRLSEKDKHNHSLAELQERIAEMLI
ncbi:MAG: dTDP-4-dehydrorhamnose 3,5-epimerase [Acutalibacteraceae bacterium]|uniref:dTDP-4-dehydrorhamnose 3,5-epimerase n=1 Tax=Hominenteromicrobium sp. TaxID=3073581 RepID=UPI001D6BF0DF|nr:dTDP-4-dehydrorhamnose 3,5-epimerase [Clostridiales bacterium]MEE0155666.1 dTDP-4-dehydrorhamnose 3,5-epimerase [Acutalibacteraceae bacterium]